MTEACKQWLKEAQGGDYTSMMREYRALIRPNYDSSCFHAQQCIEKLLKGFLAEKEVPFTKTHDLRLLFKLTYLFHPEWKVLEDEAAELSEEAVETRYPGEDRMKEDAQRDIYLCKKLRKHLLAGIKSMDQLSF